MRPEPVEGPEPAPDVRGPAGGESDDTALDAATTPADGAPGAVPTPGGTPPEPPGKLTVTDVRRLWPEVLEEVKGKRRFTWILLSQNAQVAELRNDTLLLAMANAGARDSFGRGGSEDVLREAIVVVLGADFKIETMVDPGPSSPAAPPRTPPTAQPAPAEPVRQDDRDAAASRDDSDLDDATESPSELLTRHLGAEFIAEGEQPT